MIDSRTEIRGADIAQHYDQLDAYYREVWGDQVHHGLWKTGEESLKEARNQLEEFVADEAALVGGQTVCDIGCGYGSLSRRLARSRGAEVIGVTISPAQQTQATIYNEGAGNPLFLAADWLVNTLPEASFDAAIALESSEHMADKERFFAQASRVLKPGGRLVVASWLTREAPSRLQRKWLLEPICRGSQMPQLGSEIEYRTLAAAAGLEVQRFQDLTKNIKPTWPMIVRSLLGHLVVHPRAIRQIIAQQTHSLIFAGTVLRLWIAFRTGALRYGVFTLVKADA